MPLRWDESPRSARNINAVALLKPGESIERARDGAGGIAKRLEETYPETNRGYGVQVVPIRDSYVGAGDRRIGVVLMSAVGFVLLIMCANLANLMLVRGAARQRELAVRAAMGASRGRLLWVALVGKRAAGRAWRGDRTVAVAVGGRRDDRRVPGRIAAVLARLRRRRPRGAVRDRRRDLHDARRRAAAGVARGAPESRQRPEGRRPRRFARAAAASGCRPALAVAQVALCFALLVGANLMVQSFLAMQRADLGFDHRPILAGARLSGRRCLRRLASASGVLSARSSTRCARCRACRRPRSRPAIPGDDGGVGRQLVIDGRTERDETIGVQAIGISRGCSTRIGLPLIEGRTFTEQETQDPDADVAVINQELARRLWPGESPIDRRIGFRDGDDISWLRVVGVAPNVHYEEIGEDTDQSRLNVYVPYATDGSRSMAMLVRAQGSPER